MVQVEVALAKQQSSVVLIESPTRTGVTFPERITVDGTQLNFGVMTGPEHMLILKQEGSTARHPRLVLDLKRLQLEIHFQFEYTSGRGKRWRYYKLATSLDDAFKIWTRGGGCIVLALAKIPWYYKRLEDAVIQSHVTGARVWSEEDAWTRQSDICASKEDVFRIHDSPVQMRKWLNIISLSRWTTFKLDFVANSHAEGSIKLLYDALQDYNHTPADGAALKFTRPATSIEESTWNLMNGPADTASHWDLMLTDEADMPFPLKYQLQVCISKGYICEYSITQEFLKRLAKWPTATAKQALVYVDTFQQRIYDPMTIFRDVKYTKPVRPKATPINCIELHSATVTATGIIFHTPVLEITNRVIRKYRQYGDRFLRVRFEDDERMGLRKLFAASSNKMINIFQRVKRTLQQGIVVADTTYEFLAWGNSQLRDHGVYFFASTAGITADLIRAEMGEFDDRVIAKKAARMGQCFSTTRAVSLPLQQVDASQLEPDIIRGGYNFSDGVGRISRLVAEIIHNRLKLQGDCSSLFQFRMGGCKGVLAVDPKLTGLTVRMRTSQMKFKSSANELEIIRHAQFWQPFLNRQLILILSCLGVANDVFLGMMEEAKAALDAAMLDDRSAVRALRNNVDPNHMTEAVCELVEAGFRQHQEPFVTAVLQLWRAWSLTLLKTKAKIPIRQGAFLLGTIDETATLRGHTSTCPSGHVDTIRRDPDYLDKLPEIFVQYTDPHSGSQKIVEGVCVLARNPSLQPGDIRVVRARDVLALRHHVDVVVMPQLGERDLPSMCSGGDLDGDDYIVIWDPNLIPPIWNETAEDYEGPPARTVDRRIDTHDLTQFFCDYLQNDTLGRIAVAHLAAADFFADGVRSPVCKELAELHSNAVDYPKTGVPAIMRRHLERSVWPHFMDNGRRRLYHSHKILGKLYDTVTKQKFDPDSTLPFDIRILKAANPSKYLLEEVQKIKRDYDTTLCRLLSQYGIASEFELWTTFVIRHSKSGSDYKIHEELGRVSAALKEQYAEALHTLADTKSFEDLVPIAVASYTITYYQVQLARKTRELSDSMDQDMPFISFPWILQDVLVRIARSTDDSQMNSVQSVSEPSHQGVAHEVNLLDGVGSIEIPDIVDRDLTFGTNLTSGHLPDPFVLPLEEKEPPSEDLTPGVVLELTEPPVGTLSPARFDESEANVASVFESERLNTETGAALSHEIGREVCSTLTRDIDQAFWNLKDALEEDTAYPQVIKHDGAEQPQRNRDMSSGLDDDTTTYATLPTRRRRFQNIHTAEPSRLPIREKTCFYWKYASRCNLSADECRFGHYETGVDAYPKEDMTCWFWHHNGRCTHADEDCKYAHYDTGIVAPAVVKNHARRVSGGYTGMQGRTVDADYDVSLKRSPTKTKRQVIDLESELEDDYVGLGKQENSRRIDCEQPRDYVPQNQGNEDVSNSIELDPSIQLSDFSRYYPPAPPLSSIAAPVSATETKTLPSPIPTRQSPRAAIMKHSEAQAADLLLDLETELEPEIKPDFKPKTQPETCSYADPFSDPSQRIDIDELSD